MILSILYDIKFIIGLLITLAVAAVITFYFTQRIEEQNEKIGAMSVVVQALVKELREPRHSQPQPIVMQQDGGVAEQMQTIDLAALDEINDLIEVSDDGEDSDDGESDSDNDDDMSHQTKSIQIGEAFAETINEIDEIMENRNANESDNDSEGEDTESDNEDDDSESDNEGDDSESEDDDEPIEEFIQSLDIGVSPEEVDASAQVPSILEPDQGIYKTIHISLEGADDVSFLEVPRATDYKKMSLSELRAVVLANNLCTDSSKMKKQQLYKLLGVEQ